MTITGSPALGSPAPNPSPRTTRPPARKQVTVVGGVRTTGDDFHAVPTVLKSEWIKLSTVRANKTILGLTVAINGFAAWAVATSVRDEVLTVSEVFVFPALLTAVLAAVASILLFTTEAHHGTLATSLTAQPTRWVIAASKATVTVGVGLALGATGMAAAAAGALIGGLEIGDTKAAAPTALYALLFTTLAALIGLGIGMVARHSAAAISGLLVWWFVGENLTRAFAPASVSRFLPFDAGYRLLGVGSDFDTPDILAAALPRPTLALVFAAYAAVSVAVGTALLYRRDTN
jgi:ABC-2 type transport system permease protein